MTQTIEATGIGPIKHISLELPDGGGCYLFRGSNGAGKSLLLDGLKSIVSGQGKPVRADDVEKATLSAFGINMKIGGRATRSGELEVESIEGKFPIADLVEPHIESPEAADRLRIKALIQLAGAEATESLFYDLVGGAERFGALVHTAAGKAEDPVAMANRVKRDLEAKARDAEDQAARCEARAQADREAARDIDPDETCDLDELQASLERAIAYRSNVVERVRNALKTKIDREERQKALDGAERDYRGPSVAEATAASVAADTAVFAAKQKLIEANQALSEAVLAETLVCQQAHRALEILEAAETYDRLVASWRATLADTGPPDEVSDSHAKVAEANVSDARAALERGVLVRKGRESLASAKAMQEAANEHRYDAERLRNAAAGTDDVLSRLVGPLDCPLKVRGGRLVLPTARGMTCFSDLSMGERCAVVLPIAIRKVGRRGVIPFPQELYSELDPDNKEMIHRMAHEANVWVISAEAARGELRGEVYEPEPVEA